MTEITLCFVYIENKSRLPIAITRIVLLSGENEVDCVPFPTWVLDDTRRSGKEIISRKSYYSMQMPIAISALGAVSGYVFFNQINVCFQMMPSFWTWKSIPIGAWQKYGQFHFDWRINTAIHLSDLICYRPPLLFMFPGRRTIWIAFPDPCQGRIFPVSELFFLYIVWNKFSIQYIDFCRWIWYNYPRRATVFCPDFDGKKVQSCLNSRLKGLMNCKSNSSKWSVRPRS